MTFDGITVPVDDVPATVAFYRTVLGIVSHPFDAGEEAGSRLSLGETSLGFRSRGPVDEQARAVAESEQGLGVGTVHLRFTVDNIVAAYRRAVDSGAVPVHALLQRGVDHWVATVRDRNGFLIELHSAP